jgi:hypothetical protein
MGAPEGFVKPVFATQGSEEPQSVLVVQVLVQ